MANRLNVRSIRDATGLNRADFGAQLGSSARTIRRWENGEVEPSPMAYKLLRGLSDALKDDPAPEAPGPRRKPVQAVEPVQTV